jgi:hypothetical protein
VAWPTLPQGTDTSIVISDPFTDLIFDSAFPIDANGPAFTSPASSPGGTATWGFNFWDNGGGNFGWIGVVPDNIYDFGNGGGSLTLQSVPDGGVTVAMLGFAMAGVTLIRRKVRI